MKNLEQNANYLNQSADFSIEKHKDNYNQSKSFGGSPEEFASMLNSRNMTHDQKIKAMQNKFGLDINQANSFFESTFRTFLEMDTPTTIKADIPVGDGAKMISNHLKAGNESVVVYAVGGAVRDYLNGMTPKDIDLTTNLSEEEFLKN